MTAAATASATACFLEIPPEHDFSYQNLPYGIFSTPFTSPRVGVAIGDWVLDLSVLAHEGVFRYVGKKEGREVWGVFFFFFFVRRDMCPSHPSFPLHPHSFDASCFHAPALNAFMAHPRAVWTAARETIRKVLSKDEPLLQANAPLRARALVPLASVTMHLPAEIGDYTDFYSSREHATNVGIMFRGKENALQPNWLHLPVGYHGRASSVVVSGTPVVRPQGQLQADAADDVRLRQSGVCVCVWVRA